MECDLHGLGINVAGRRARPGSVRGTVEVLPCERVERRRRGIAAEDLGPRCLPRCAAPHAGPDGSGAERWRPAAASPAPSPPSRSPPSILREQRHPGPDRPGSASRPAARRLLIQSLGVQAGAPQQEPTPHLATLTGRLGSCLAGTRLAHFSALGPFAEFIAAGERVAPRAGFEPATQRLTAACSTN